MKVFISVDIEGCAGITHWDEAEKKQAEEAATAFKPMLDRLKDALKDRAKDVRVTTRLVDSPACLVVDEGDRLVGAVRRFGQRRDRHRLRHLRGLTTPHTRGSAATAGSA